MIDINQIKLIDLIPSSIRNDPTVKAAAESIDRQLEEVTQIIPKIVLMQNIDTLPEKWVDQLAYQFHVDFYDPDLPLDQKRELVKNSLPWHKRKGTPSAVEEIISTIFGDGKVEEWFEYGGQPGCFRVSTTNPSATNAQAQEFIQAVQSVKRLSSKLDDVILKMTDELNQYTGGILYLGDHLTIRQVV